jgi:putative transposase
VRALVAQLAR